MAQSLGYFLGAVGPFALGKTFSLASNWTVPLAMLLAFSGIEILAGYMAGRPIVIPAEKHGQRNCDCNEKPGTAHPQIVCCARALLCLGGGQQSRKCLLKCF